MTSGEQIKVDPLQQLAAAVRDRRSQSDALDSVTGNPMPPIERWSPAFCGDLDMEIRADGTWWHEGTAIKRPELVKLFASILRRESDGHYYLITPVEKVRIRVALHPLIVIDAEPLQGSNPEILILTLNTGGQIPLDANHSLAVEPAAGGAAFVSLDRGLTALFSRPAWYRLVDRLDDNGILHSGEQSFPLV
jgi:uncharacterized protein